MASAREGDDLSPTLCDPERVLCASCNRGELTPSVRPHLIEVTTLALLNHRGDPPGVLCLGEAHLPVLRRPLPLALWLILREEPLFYFAHFFPCSRTMASPKPAPVWAKNQGLPR